MHETQSIAVLLPHSFCAQQRQQAEQAALEQAVVQQSAESAAQVTEMELEFKLKELDIQAKQVEIEREKIELATARVGVRKAEAEADEAEADAVTAKVEIGANVASRMDEFQRNQSPTGTSNSLAQRSS